MFIRTKKTSTRKQITDSERKQTVWLLTTKKYEHKTDR